MPVVRKVMRYLKVPIAIAHLRDVEARDRFIVQTWHRSALIENGRIIKVFYGYSYPPSSGRQDPAPSSSIARCWSCRILGEAAQGLRAC